LILDNIKRGRTVVTNLPLTFEDPLISLWTWEQFEEDKPVSLLDDSPQIKIDYPKGSVYVLDECWRGFPDAKTPLNEKIQSFFKEHRHRANAQGVTDDIFLVTQDLSDIPLKVRNLCKQTILCDKPDDIGLDNVSVRYYMKGAIKGLIPVHSQMIKTEREIIKPEIYKLYKSHTMSDNAATEFSEGTAIKSTFWQSGKFKLMIAGIFSALLVIGISGNHVLTKTLPKYQNIEGSIGSREETKTESITVSKATEPLKITTAVDQMPVMTKPTESTRWRVAAWVKPSVVGQGKEAVYIIDVTNRPKRIDRNLCIEEFKQLTCTIGLEIITAWTGPNGRTNLDAGLTKATQQIASN